MGYRIVVCVKQVPDTENLTGQAMREDGTVNRTALPAIFNPEDLNALELALRIKDEHGGHVTALTMGLPKAADVLRECLYRGADAAVLLTDRRLAAADTLATSYALSRAVRRIGQVDLVLCGRQAIDGDTAQVGPQCAEKLGLPQITYLEEIVAINGRQIVARRNIGNGYEVVECAMPVLLTVTDTFQEPRPYAAKAMLKCKHARSRLELEREAAQSMPGSDEKARAAAVDQKAAELKRRGLLIEQWTLDDIHADLAWCGRDGSPTKVKRIQSVVLKGSGHEQYQPTEGDISRLVHQLIEDHTIG